jgi:carboxyl-terminal processing protease
MTRKTFIGLMSAILIATPLAGQSSANSGSGRAEGPSVTSGAQTFLGAFQAIRDYGLEAVGDSALWDRAVEGLIRELPDPYAQVFRPAEFDQFQEDNTGNYAGIGVQITNLNESITITAVFRGTPAERSGIQVGDLIIGVNDQSTEGWTTGVASDSIRGEVGTSVKLALARAGLTAPLTPTISRDSVHVSAVVSGLVDSDVGYIGLDRVARASSEEVDSALVKFRSSKGVILDLRGNPGGYLDESLMIGDLFLDRGLRLASAESRVPGESKRNQDEAWDARMPDRFPNKPVIVLVDRFSASAAEIVAGALQDHDRALVIGERTFGKGVFQNVFRLTEKRHLRLTTGEWFTPLGRSLHRPRTAQGRPVPEDPDTFPVIKTKAGRELVSGGGIFPDLEITNDTLTLLEREFLSQAARKQIPLALRIAEFAFSQADSHRRSGAEPGVDADDLRGFIDALGEEGIDEEYLENPLVASYLEWRVSILVAERMDQLGRSIEFRSQRDPVVAEAIRLLKSVGTQEDLFAAADRVRAAQEDTGEGSAGS